MRKLLHQQLLFICAVISVSFCSREHILKSPEITNFGQWGNWDHCPEGQYAAGIQIKYEVDQGSGDDTALNAVALYCLPLNSTHYDEKTWIMSAEGRFGSWQGVKWCPRGQVIVGFALKSQSARGDHDDVGTENFAAYCGYPYGPRPTSVYIQGDVGELGRWTTDQWCPEGYAACGIQTQVESPQGRGDDTSLNNINIKCCEMDDVSCTPGYALVIIQTFDNSLGDLLMTSTFKTRTSFTHSSRTLSSSEKRVVASNIKGKMLRMAFDLKTELAYYREKVRTNSLHSMLEEAIQEDREQAVTIAIPGRTATVIKQLYLTCGEYRIGLEKTVNETK